MQALTAPLQMPLRVSEPLLCQTSGTGTVSSNNYSNAALNRHLPFHCSVIDASVGPVEDIGDVSESGRFHPAAELISETVAFSAEQVRLRLLRGFVAAKLSDPENLRAMLAGPDQSSVR